MQIRENEEDTASLSPSNDSTLYRRALPGLEDELSWPQLLETWMTEYQPDSPSFKQHVLRAAQADLVLQQEERRFDKANREWLKAKSEVSEWDAKQNKLYREMKWRLDGAERTLLRWCGTVERMRRSRLLDRAAVERLNSKSQNSSPDSAAAGSRPSPLFATASLPYLQIINARVVNGVTKTIYNPPSKDLLQTLRLLKRDGIPVRRVLRFPLGLPPEYEWARSEDGEAPLDVEWSMPQEDFAAEVNLEEKAGKGHVLKSKHLPVREVVLLD